MGRKVPLIEVEHGKVYTLVMIEEGGVEVRARVKAEVVIRREVTLIPVSPGEVIPGPMMVNQWLEEE